MFQYFLLDTGSWHQAPKSPGISWQIEMSFVLMRWILVESCMGHWKDQAIIRTFNLELSTPLLIVQRGEGGWKYRVNPFLSKNLRSMWFRELLSWWTQRCWESGVPREDTEAPHPFPYSLPYSLFHLDVHLYHLSYSFTINWCFPTRVKCA